MGKSLRLQDMTKPVQEAHYAYLEAMTQRITRYRQEIQGYQDTLQDRMGTISLVQHYHSGDNALEQMVVSELTDEVTALDRKRITYGRLVAILEADLTAFLQQEYHIAHPQQWRLDMPAKTLYRIPFSQKTEKKGV